MLEKELIKDPRLGVPLGNDRYKIRLKITSKGKGKSGGARVITLVENEIIGIAEDKKVKKFLFYFFPSMIRQKLELYLTGN